MKHYTQLTEPERNQIYALKQAGFKPSAIALQLSRRPATICRELRRNRGLRGYRPRQAQQMADPRRREKAKPKTPEAAYGIVNDLMEKDWSPEQISGWLAAEKNVRISHERICQHIARDRKQGGSLHLHLRCRKKRKKLMEALTGGVRSGVVCRQTGGLILLKNAPELVTGRPTQQSADAAGLSLSRWLSASPVSASSPLRRTNGRTVSHRLLPERCSHIRNKFKP